jgi:class 3 adenylate cyclase
MNNNFTKLIPKAKGRSEWIIVTFFDIRDFSRFSERVEAPNIALYLKKVFVKAMDSYFPPASFCKSTGDGLMLIHSYDEDNVGEVLNQVVDSCIKLHKDFSTLVKDEPAINFEPPSSVGIGLVRGTACCLYSADETIDYSGKIINLAARLTNLARPSGIVFDTSLGFSLLNEKVQKLFDKASVYITGIAEQIPVDIYYLKGSVILSPESKKPLSKQEWYTITKRKKYKEWLKLSRDPFSFTTKHRNIASDTIYTEVYYPTRIENGTMVGKNVYHFVEVSDLCEIHFAGDEETIDLNLPSVVKRIGDGTYKPLNDDDVSICIKYQTNVYL